VDAVRWLPRVTITAHEVARAAGNAVGATHILYSSQKMHNRRSWRLRCRICVPRIADLTIRKMPQSWPLPTLLRVADLGSASSAKEQNRCTLAEASAHLQMRKRRAKQNRPPGREAVCFLHGLPGSGLQVRHQLEVQLQEAGDEAPEVPVRLFVVHDHLLCGPRGESSRSGPLPPGRGCRRQGGEQVDNEHPMESLRPPKHTSGPQPTESSTTPVHRADCRVAFPGTRHSSG